MTILVQEPCFEEQELRAMDKVQQQQLEKQQEFCLVDAGLLPSSSSIHLLASQDLAHIQHQNTKQRKEEFNEWHTEPGTTFGKGKS